MKNCFSILFIIVFVLIFLTFCSRLKKTMDVENSKSVEKTEEKQIDKEKLMGILGTYKIDVDTITWNNNIIKTENDKEIYGDYNNFKMYVKQVVDLKEFGTFEYDGKIVLTDGPWAMFEFNFSDEVFVLYYSDDMDDFSPAYIGTNSIYNDTNSTFERVHIGLNYLNNKFLLKYFIKKTFADVLDKSSKEALHNISEEMTDYNKVMVLKSIDEKYFGNLQFSDFIGMYAYFIKED
jgi:hypothetical protein